MTPGAEMSIPERPFRGPLGRRSIRRASFLLGGIWAIGLVPAVVDASDAARAFGLGLLLPGAGFLYGGSLALFALTFVVAVVGVQLMFLRADMVTAPVATLLGAGGAAAVAGPDTHGWALWAVPATLAVLLCAGAVAGRLAHRRARRRGRARNEYLSRQEPLLTVPDETRVPAVTELSEDELELQRWVLDRALQPPDDWSAFEVHDQYSLRSLRYQLNWLQWALALAQYAHAPAFTGYLGAAQRNLIDRMVDRRVWAYWRNENLWGNLDPSPDPIVRDNIMFSGYLGMMLGTYAAVTGDRRYDRAGSLTFRWSGRREFAYDHPSVVDAVERNLGTSEWGMFACEPGLVFPACNTFAMVAVVLRDALDDTSRSAELLGRFRTTLEDEYIAADGDIIPMISPRLGWSMRPARSAALTLTQSYYLRPLLPQLTDRAWAIARHEILDGDPDEGDAEPTGRLGRARIFGDWGRFAPSNAGTIQALMAVGRELGDEDAYQTALDAAKDLLDYRVREGVGCFEQASLTANAGLAMAAFGRRDGWWDLVRRGVPSAWHRGPRLGDASYPEVLVARAATDGQALELVLRPGRRIDGRTALRLEGLRPGRRYAASGDHGSAFLADSTGRATIHVALPGRTELRVWPVFSPDGAPADGGIATPAASG